MGRFHAAFQLAYNAVFGAASFLLSPDANAWWPLFGAVGFLSLALFSWGVGVYLNSARIGGLVFVAIMSGVTVNLDGHLFDTWPSLEVCFAFWGAGLACEREAAPSRAWAALFYFLAICLGNEEMVLFVLGLAGGRVLAFRRTKGRKDLAKECAAPVLGGLLFVLCFLAFRHWFPPTYEGSVLSLQQPWHSFLAWRNISLSELPAYDFFRLLVRHGGHFASFILSFAWHPGWMAVLLGFTALCVAAGRYLLRWEEGEGEAPPERRTALAWGLLLGVLVSNVPLAFTSKYREWYRSAHHGFYYTYSFYGYAALCVLAVLLFWKIRHGARVPQRWKKMAPALLLAFLALNAVSSTFSSRYYLAKIVRLRGYWSLFESLVSHEAEIFPDNRVCHVVAPQFAILPGMTWLNAYWEAKASLCARRKGLPPPGKIDFIEKPPERRQPGESYYLLHIDDSLSDPFQGRAVLWLAPLPPGFPGQAVRGPVWLFADPMGGSGVNRRAYPQAAGGFRETELSPGGKTIRLDDFTGDPAQWAFHS
ncbi:MAG: hypothetical protein PW734_10940 [Verrucomicrobium sp.]|nr:hypothetical protein [Verrucomicrobium sp.]